MAQHGILQETNEPNLGKARHESWEREKPAHHGRSSGAMGRVEAWVFLLGLIEIDVFHCFQFGLIVILGAICFPKKTLRVGFRPLVIPWGIL